MPPGFMNATCAPPSSAGAVAASWLSAMTSPSADSPAAFGVAGDVGRDRADDAVGQRVAERL